jgi:hypothetical protein
LQVSVPWRQVSGLTKEKTALVIPNAIQVSTTNNERLFFTSFGARDKTFVMLFRIWQNALLDQVCIALVVVDIVKPPHN